MIEAVNEYELLAGHTLERAWEDLLRSFEYRAVIGGKTTVAIESYIQGLWV